MGKFICLQSGHEGRTSGSTGSPGEIELNVRIRNRLAQILIEKGFQLQLVNADPEDTLIAKDFDLFLTLHGDANIYGTGGGMVDYPEPSTDAATVESQRIAKCITEEYFDHSGIVNHPERSNANTRYYYMWRLLSARTPCVLVEMGVVQDAHDKVLLADTERIASALARGICKAFGVQYDITTTTQTTSTTSTTVTTNPTPGAPSEVLLLQNKLHTIHDIIWGKGFVWTKLNKVKEILPKIYA